MIKSITNFLIIFFIFQQLKSQISQIDQNGYNAFCDETIHFVSWEPKGRKCRFTVFRWEPGGYCLHRLCTATALFFCQTVLTPFWFSTDDLLLIWTIDGVLRPCKFEPHNRIVMHLKLILDGVLKWLWIRNLTLLISHLSHDVTIKITQLWSFQFYDLRVIMLLLLNSKGDNSAQDTIFFQAVTNTIIRTRKFPSTPSTKMICD